MSNTFFPTILSNYCAVPSEFIIVWISVMKLMHAKIALSYRAFWIIAHDLGRSGFLRSCHR